MSNSVWSDNELAELQPRRNPPPLFSSPQGIPAVRPQVPEISLFIPSVAQKVIPDSVPEAKKEKPVDSPKVNSPLELSVPSPPRDPISEDVLNILRLQSDQLMKLQTQVQRLLSIQSEKETEDSSPIKCINQSTESFSRLNQDENAKSCSPPTRTKSPMEVFHSCSPRNLSDNFTQTSAPSTPRKKQAETNTTPPCQSLEEAQVLQFLDSSSANLSPRSLCFQVKDFLQDSRTQSILLGESASTYGNKGSPGDDNSSFSEEQFEKILCQVQRLLSPIPGSSAPETSERSSPCQTSESENQVNRTLIKTVNRVKQMGASFLQPSDFLSSVKERNPIDTFYEPKAEDSSSHLETIPSNASSDASLIINTAAMKYLNDDQLSSLAAVSPRQPNVERLNRPFGLPESHLSVSTRRFLQQHQLFDEPHSSSTASSEEPKVIDNIQSILQQPKLS